VNEWDNLLDLYIGELIPTSEILDKIKTNIYIQINKEETDKIYEGVFNTPAYRKTAEIFKKAFSVLEQYNLKRSVFYGSPVYDTEE
jgi:hypothetical protein